MKLSRLMNNYYWNGLAHPVGNALCRFPADSPFNALMNPDTGEWDPLFSDELLFSEEDPMNRTGSASLLQQHQTQSQQQSQQQDCSSGLAGYALNLQTPSQNLLLDSASHFETMDFTTTAAAPAPLAQPSGAEELALRSASFLSGGPGLGSAAALAAAAASRRSSLGGVMASGNSFPSALPPFSQPSSSSVQRDVLWRTPHGSQSQGGCDRDLAAAAARAQAQALSLAQGSLLYQQTPTLSTIPQQGAFLQHQEVDPGTSDSPLVSFPVGATAATTRHWLPHGGRLEIASQVPSVSLQQPSQPSSGAWQQQQQQQQQSQQQPWQHSTSSQGPVTAHSLHARQAHQPASHQSTSQQQQQHQLQQQSQAVGGTDGLQLTTSAASAQLQQQLLLQHQRQLQQVLGGFGSMGNLPTPIRGSLEAATAQTQHSAPGRPRRS
ncbi:MAG: hypothetical protein WDW38_007667 [Sanguina aurantia]